MTNSDTTAMRSSKTKVAPTGYIRSSAAVGTSRHSHDDGIVPQTILFANLLDFVNQQWQILS